MQQKRTLGEEITFQRKKKGYTQEELAEISGVSRGHLSQIELGRKTPGEKTLAKLEDALGLPFMYLQRSAKKKKTGETVEEIIRDIKLDLLRRELSERNVRIISEIVTATADILEENEEIF